MTQYIKKLPAVFQTVTEKKFFDATFDQVFSKKDSDLLYGYIGQRNPGHYDPVNDFYLPEPTKDRTWWQLEATAFAKNADSTKSNIFFYDDLLNRINYYGGNTLNQDRLFESEYYSWAPPIDFDMFMNYQNYYWIEQGLVTINISGLTDVEIADIIGQPTYTTPITATPANFTFTTGLKVQFTDSVAYPDPLTVENIGGCTGLRLVPQFPDYAAGTILEFLPWDGTVQLANGRIIQNTNWDTLTWDIQPQPGNGDYITIERGSVDENAWSRTNKWYHIDAINRTIAATGTSFPVNSTRALRPIIQFSADLLLYNSGTQFKDDISYGFRGNIQGAPLLLADYQGQTESYINTALDIELEEGQLAVFMEDSSVATNIYQISIDVMTNIVTFNVFGTPVVDGDIVFATADAPFNGLQRGQTYYYDVNAWSQAANDKVTTNQPPLFQLYDHNGIELDNAVTYPNSSFAGSKIFSYKINSTPGATVDPVLKFPIVYTSLGQSTDIVFQNNLITDRYVYGPEELPVNGYYYYKFASNPVQYNDWNLYAPCQCDDIVPPPPCNCINVSKQRIIDKFVVGYGTQYQFRLSVTPYGYPASPDIIVSVNGIEVKNSSEQTNGYNITSINNDLYVDLQDYLTALLLTPQSQPPVVEVDTYTHGLLANDANGYFEIPQQLNANPSQEEVTEISASNLIEQFSSIIENQIGFTGIAFGGDNNYRDTRKNRTLGSFILQNVSPALKSMLISSDNDLDVIAGIRFSQDEYTKFKNKYLRTAQQLINQEFNPVQYHNNTVVISAWVDEIIKTVNVSKEFSSAFAYSYMIANGTPYVAESVTVPLSGIITLTNYIDLTDPKNALYVYDVSGQETLLMVGIDYEVISTNLAIDVQFNASLIGSDVYVALYKNPLPAYIPSTPTKVGTYGTFIPRIELDTSYTIPTNVIIGHDGSKSIAYGDYRDNLLLELEKRIYNLLQFRFRNEYYLPLRVESVKSGYYRETRYSREEYLAITESYINKWSAKNRANYRVNDWTSSSEDLPLNSPELWKLYNYSEAVTPTGVKLGLPGNWKGIYQYYYDTIFPNTRPWEMLGFSSQPVWWVAEYGTDWTPTNIALWADLEAGIIRQGPSAIFDPVTLLPLPQEMWARPGLSANIPVDAAGNIRPILDVSNPANSLFDVAYSGNPYAPFDGFDNTWTYGDGAPVEQAWMSTSGYAFSIQEFLYLMKPGPFGELFFDTVGTELSPGKIDIPGIYGPVMSSDNWQYVQNDTFTNSDPFFAWMRPKNIDQVVHAETIDNTVQIRYGYQRWISDKILFLGKDIGTTFGQKVRTLDVNLANKLAGFTNKDTTATYIESVSTSATTTSLLVPTNNFDVILHKGQPIKTYAYSGVVIRALADGTFVVYGYDLLNSAFTVLNRSDAQLIDITIGGTPAEFKTYTIGETYYSGDIVRYNGVYYLSLGTVVAGKFDISNWQKLRALPTVGGVSVIYKPISETTSVTVPYGSILTTAQEVFDLLIGWGAYLETQGWQFTDVSVDTNQVSDWLYSAKQFLFWLNTNWAPDASIQLSPAANNAILTVQAGYPDDVETISNGVYSILDKFGVAIPPNGTSTDREGTTISVSPVDLSIGGIYFLQVSASETEHVLIFDNTTSFNDVIYSPLLRARQQRLRFNGFRSNGWYGKKEAPGYLIIENQLVPNYDTIVDSMKYYYDPDVTIDNPSLEALGRHLIGYESKSYLDNLQVSNDVQYLFYQGAIRQKGTIQAFDKLFRSTKVQSNEVIEVYEEWALKLGNFGNTVEQVSTEFILKPEQNTGEVIVARLNFVPSTIGTVKLINIVNAENRYVSVPKIIISPPDANPSDPALTQHMRTAKAYAVLNSSGVISRIDITDTGYGYLSAPYITIDSGTEPHQLDKLYSVWQGEIIKDPTLDNIVEIDIDDTDTWIVRPPDPQYTLEFPTTDIIDYSTPNAGYVNFNDVDMTSFNVAQTESRWGSALLNPTINDTIWIAKTFTEDWDVYKMCGVDRNQWKVVATESGNLLLLTVMTTKIVPQFSTVTGDRTDFGNMICLQISEAGIVVGETNYTMLVQPSIGSSTTDPWGEPEIYTDPDTLDTYYSYDLTSLDGTPLTADDIGVYEDLNQLLLFKTMRWHTQPVEPLLPTYVGINDLIWVDDIDGKWAVIKITADPGFWDISYWDSATVGFWGHPQTYNYGWDIIGPMYFTPIRVQEKLINTSLFESAQVFQTRTETELVLLPVYDPFKGILPALAKQNITYMLLQDPARYNVTGDARLFSNNITFGEAQVGKLWWDMSEVRYVYCEQPVALDGSETSTQNLAYRRNRWGQIFPGSTIDIYEWTKSPVPPELYTGTGIPRDITTYVQIATSNRFTNTTEINYYFWVLNPTDKPNIENRTLAALEVSRLLSAPKSQGFTFFCPIQQTSRNNSYMFYNVQEILAYQGDNVQIQYRLAERNDQKHTQWKFFREGDTGSLVTSQYWDKMVDSLCGYTKLLPVSTEWDNGIYVASELPWDIYGWDIAPWDDAINTTSEIYGEVLPVPDPALSESEKYGIEYRPRQGMFVNLYAARKIFVQSGNNLLKHIPIRDNNPTWNTNVSTDVYWEYTDWYEVGFENVIPSAVFSTLADAQTALTNGLLTNGTIVEVINGTSDNRFVLYNVVQLNPNISVQSFQKVGIELSAIKLLDTIYTVKNVYGLSVELRELLDAFRTAVMVNSYIVDQNELYFSMLNYVFSEQKTPNWAFKTSYIFIKENNIPLTQSNLYMPDQIDNVINYIIDSKPYHTQIRDYTSTYLTSDVAIGTAEDFIISKTTIQFGPDYGGPYENGHWDAPCEGDLEIVSLWGMDPWGEDPWGELITTPTHWDSTSWDVCPNNFSHILDAGLIQDNTGQLVSTESTYTVPLTTFDPSKIGYSALYPYTFSLLTIDGPQTFITPEGVINVVIGDTILNYGQDYYVGYNVDETYTVYFYQDPGTLIVPQAIVLWNGGNITRFKYGTNRTEIAYGNAIDNFVVNVDTKLPVNDVAGVYYPIAPWGTTDFGVDPVVAQAITDAGGTPVYNPLTPVTSATLPVYISYKQNLGIGHNNFYRNNEIYSGVLVNTLAAPTTLTENLDVITVTATTDIFPEAAPASPAAIWINGEKIVYRVKTEINPTTWELSIVQRGKDGTAPVEHLASSIVWIEHNNVIRSTTVSNSSDIAGYSLFDSNVAAWNATNQVPDLSTELLDYSLPIPAPFNPPRYSSIAGASTGGVWYASTQQAEFLKDGLGKAVP